MDSPKRAFVTGVTGFVGTCLAAHLNERRYQVYGMDRWPTCGCPDVTYYEGNILDTAALAHLFSSTRPGLIIHLAGVSFPADADTSPQNALEINIMGAASVCEAAFQACASSKLLLVGSSKQYSDTAFVKPVSEETPCRPTNFYGISKYAAELIGMQYLRQHGMDIRFTRSFNHTGPGQSERFVCSDWTKQTAAITLGKAEAQIKVGDTTPAIDFTDVRDVVRAYLLILETGAKGEAYNVCSGSAVSLEEVLEGVVRRSGKKIEIVRDPARVHRHRTGEKNTGDRGKLTRATGWEPEIPLSRTLDDLYRYWLTALSRPAATA